MLIYNETRESGLISVWPDPSQANAYDAAFLRKYAEKNPVWFIVQDEPDALTTITTQADAGLFGWPAYEQVLKRRHELFMEYYKKMYWNQNDGQNGKILDSLVESDILCNMSSIMDYILGKGWEDPDAPYTWEDAINNDPTEEVTSGQWRVIFSRETDADGTPIDATFYSIDEDGGDVKEFTAQIADLLQQPDVDDYDLLNLHLVVRNWIKESGERRRCDDVLGEFDSVSQEDGDSPEVLEFWAISNRLFNWLKDAGEVVFDGQGSPDIWGRQTSGQLISSDGVIARVARDHGILYGLKHEWSAK